MERKKPDQKKTAGKSTEMFPRTAPPQKANCGEKEPLKGVIVYNGQRLSYEKWQHFLETEVERLCAALTKVGYEIWVEHLITQAAALLSESKGAPVSRWMAKEFVDGLLARTPSNEAFSLYRAWLKGPSDT